MVNLERMVIELLARFKVMRAPVPIERIAKGLGATLQFEPFEGKDDVSGMLFRDDKRTVIGVNSKHVRTRQRFTIAHECGHLLRHKGKMYVDARVNFRDAVSGLAVDKEEIEANAFAAEILMPRTLVISEIESQLQKHDSQELEIIIKELSRIFDVSTQAMEFRLKNLGLLGE